MLALLKKSILKESPGVKLVLSSYADSDENIGDMDMIVTATSGAGKKILDINRVKPGCVITDVARPLDLPPEEVAESRSAVAVYRWEWVEVLAVRRRFPSNHLTLQRRFHDFALQEFPYELEATMV